MKNGKIEMTCVVDAAIGTKLPVIALEDLLNEQINLNDYGSSVQKIFFVFIAVSPKNAIHEPHIVYTESKAHLEIALKLNYKKALETEGEELLGLLQTLFLEGIDLCRKTNLGGYSWINLFKDVKILFT